MLGFITGVLTMICVALVLTIIYLIKRPKSELQKQTEEELRKMKEYNSHYDNLMNYNLNIAYSGGRNG